MFSFRGRGFSAPFLTLALMFFMAVASMWLFRGAVFDNLEAFQQSQPVVSVSGQMPK